MPTNNLLENNVFVQVKEPIHGSKDWLDLKPNNWITDQDPGFVDWKKRNFALKPRSLIYKKLPAFREIPFDSIGLYARKHSVIK